MKKALYISLFVAAGLASPMVLCSQTITGTVFQDVNFNGAKDATDPGVGGVVISAYDDNDPIGTPTATATANTTGAYTLSGLTAAVKYRLEIKNPNTWLYPGPNGTGSQTTVRVATAGATNVNFGLVSPADFCQATPDVILPCYVSGNPLGGGTGGSEDALIKIAYTAANTSPAPVHLERASKIGTVWATAYQRETNMIFSTAFLKRHAGIGPGGLGAIYRTDAATFNMTVVYANLSSLGVTLAAPADLTYINTTRNGQLPAVSTTASQDAQVMGLIGKVGMGGMDICPTGDTLWIVNLYEKKLIRVLLGNPYKASLTAADVTQYLIPDPGCSSGSWRPWAVRYDKGKIYVGGICDAGSGGVRNNLQAYVYTFSPVTNTFNATPIISFPLSYNKGATHTGDAALGKNWEPWRDTWADIFKGQTLSAGIRSARPQPILSDLDFDDSGNMVLSFTDRGGHQLGVGQQAIPDDNKRYNGYINGDLLIAKNNGDGTFSIESNGAITGKTGSGVGNAQGPGGGEFFSNDIYPSTGSQIHQETAMGASLILPGKNEVMTISMDPLSVWTGGVNVFNLTNGSNVRRYQIYATGPGANGTQGKANGLGLTVAACNPAPIEIGNYVWLDSDGDGVQDPGESGIANITVQLRRVSDNSLIATAVTDGSGFYLFSNATGSSTGSVKYGLTNLTYFTDYKVVVPNVTGGSKQTALGTNVLTSNDTGGSDVNADFRDSDGITSGSNAETAVFTTGSGAKNNHTFDFGFKPYVAPQPPAPCTFISGLSSNIATVCNAARGINFTITHDATLVPAQTMKLVYSTTSLTATQLYSGSGTALVTGIAPVTGQTSKLVAATMPANGGASPVSYYVYVVFETAPADPTCRPFGLVSPITVTPQVAAATLSGIFFEICDRDDTGTPAIFENVKNLNSLVSGNTGGVWTVNPSPAMSGTFSAGVYTAAQADAGKTFTFTYTLAGAGPTGSDCDTKTYTVTIKVNACPCYNTQTICGTEDIDASVPLAAYTVTWYKENGAVDIQVGAAGDDQINITSTGEYYYIGTDENGCAVELCCRILVTQNTLPAIINTNLQTICNINKPSTAGTDNAFDLDNQFVSGNSGGTWALAPSSPVPAGTFNSGTNVFTAATADAGITFTFRYTIVGVGGCPNLTYDVPIYVESCVCPTFNSILTPGTVCTDETYALTLYHTEAPLGGNVEFYYTTFPFLLAANLYAPNHGGATLIGTVPIGTNGSTTVNNVQLPPSGQSVTYYIHAIYVPSPAIAGCQPFVINETTVIVQGPTVPASVGAPAPLCNIGSGNNDNVLNLMTLVTGNTTGTWSSTNPTANAAISGNVFTATAGMAGQTFTLTYTAPGASGSQTSVCGDLVYTTNLTIIDCSCPAVDILTTSGTPSSVCSNEPFSIKINHRSNLGNLQLYYILDTGNDGTELTATQLYSVGNGGATALGAVISPVANTSMTTVSGLSLPVNTSGSVRNYIIYVGLASGNPNISNPSCLPISQKLIAVLPETPTATVSASASVCESGYSSNQNVIDLNTLITAGFTGGTWLDSGNSGGLSGHTFTASPSMAPVAGVANQSSFNFTYKISGAAAGACGDRTYTATVNVGNCAVPNCASILSVAPVNPATCSNSPFDLTIQHSAGIGALSIYWGETTAYNDYNFYNSGIGNADVHFLADITPAALATTTTATGLTLPVYNGPNSRDVYLYVVLKSTNPGLSVPYCIPYAYNTMQQDPFIMVNAGTDGSIATCDNSNVAIDLFNVITGEQAGGTWTRLTGTGGTFVAATGLFTPAGATTSTFQYFVTGSLSCPGDQSVATVTVGSAPAGKFVPVPAQCINLVEQNDGRIVLTAYSNADRFGISLGTTYSGSAYAGASAITGTNQNLITGISNASSTTYTVRLFNGSDACYKDFVVVVPANFPCKSDPMGYIYCEETGQIITGGTIAVTPPAGATYVITQNGYNGIFQLFTDGTAGVYTLTYTPPAGYMLSTTRLPSGTLDPTGNPNPYIIGSGSTNSTTLDNFTAAANPFYLSFDFALGDPEIFNNNIPLKGCCDKPALVVNNGQVCNGGSVDLAALVTNAGGGTLSFHATLADAQNDTGALVSSTVSPSGATNYYVRSELNSVGGAVCYTVKEVTITIKATNCGVITVTGPN